MERIRRRGLEIALGIGLIGAIVVAVTLILVSFSGGFSDKITVSATLSEAGDSLAQGDIVTYLNVIVGEVSDSTGKSDGSAVATLRIDPHDADQIPASVQAIAVPASLFGNTKIELVPRARDRGGPHLSDGGLVKADRSPAAESLQTALSNAYDLLTSVHPAQLDAALSALATALDGRGAQVNALIHKADRYLRRLAPHLPELDSTLTSLATVTDHLAANAPSMLASLRNLLVVSKGILNSRDAVDSLLLVAPTALDNAQKLLVPKTVDNIVSIVRDQQPVTAALGDNPTAPADTINGFKSFADTFNKALGDGPFLNANLILTGADFADLVPVAAGQEGKVFDSIVDPPLYTPADCPRYVGASGPNCGTSTAVRTSSASTSSANTRSARSGDAARYQVLTSGTNYASDSAIGTPGEIQVVTSAAESITGLPASSVSGITADVLLGPLLRGTSTVINP